MSQTVMVLRFTIDEQPYALPICDDATLGLTPREHRRISDLSGTRGVAALADAVQAFDVPTLTALAIVAAERAGAKPDADSIFDGKSTLTFDADGPEGPFPADAAEETTSTASGTASTPASSGAQS